MEGHEGYIDTILCDYWFCIWFAEAFKANLISDEAWMNMLKVRNELTHDYDCEIVKTNCNTIVEKYIDLFYDFEKVVKQLEM